MSDFTHERRGRKRPRDVSNPIGLQQQADAVSATETMEVKVNSPPILKPRAYQTEMVNESMRRNIIVAVSIQHLSTPPKQINKKNRALDGNWEWKNTNVRFIFLAPLSLSLHKRRLNPIQYLTPYTDSAVIRIREELQRCPNHKLVWFTTPTVALAEQQHRVLSAQLPAFQARLLSGADGVEHWSTQKIWDDILLNIRIVVSTPQVLLDALSNGFLSLRRVALLVFDEAHHCIASAPGSRTMRDFYHAQIEELRLTNDLPYVLGLTASPVTRVHEDKLRELETNLDAICKTPQVHREDMMKYVHIPELQRISFPVDMTTAAAIETMLFSILENLDINLDPYVKRLRKRNDLKSLNALQKILQNGKTPCYRQLKRCFDRTVVLCDQLGLWAAETFFSECYRRIREKCATHLESKWTEWDRDDNLYICEILSRVQVNPLRGTWKSIPDDISMKAGRLIDYLVSEHPQTSIGIIFVESRAMAVMLNHLLSMEPRLKHILSGSYLGNSASASRGSDITELTDPDDQKNFIEDLKKGKKNFLISTSVLEEGIDVSACDVVICFDPPKEVRSFIQRRGRARKKDSKFIIFLPDDGLVVENKWTKMEDAMKEMYSANRKYVEELEALENIVEDGYEGMRIDSTGALLTLENAQPHLYHFCSTLHCAFTDSQPDFVILNVPGEEQLAAKVVLPNFLDPRYREFHGKLTWKTERMAKRDAAFQAYVKLYEAGLVDDHLMPAHVQPSEEESEPIHKRPGVTTVSAPFNPWIKVSRGWGVAEAFSQASIEIASDSESLPPMLMILPIPLPCDINFNIFWNEAITFTVSMKQQPKQFPLKLVKLVANATRLLLSSSFSQRMLSGCMDFSYLFAPNMPLTNQTITDWNDSISGSIQADSLEPHISSSFGQFGLVRPLDSSSRPWTLDRCIWKKPEAECSNDDGQGGEEVLHLEGKLWPKRADFLHPVQNSDGSAVQHTATKCYPASCCSIDRLPVGYARFALFIPSLVHNIEIFLVAEELRNTILAPVNFQNLNLVVTAISASVAREQSNYQRLEFLGDSFLKLHTSLQLSANNPHWHEGLLSHKKDVIVSNGRLAKAAINVGLDKFILTKPFTGAKWRPSYNLDHARGEANEAGIEREMSTKVLADVVEALIGAATIDGGKYQIFRCLQIFLPEVNWLTYDEQITRLYDDTPELQDASSHAVLSKIEDLIGHEFTRKILLHAAMAHPSNQTAGMSYQRLEFIGDSILDTLITSACFRSPKELAHYDMHLIRTAMVNADFLAFLCMTTFTEEERGEILDSSKGNTKAMITTKKIYLWQYMSHSASLAIIDAQRETSQRLQELQHDIHQALISSNTYPWTLLSALDAAKFFSDLIESILGAIFIDTHGSMDACHAFLARIGLLQYLNRVLEGGVDILHPKERLGHVAGNRTVEYDSRQVSSKGTPRWVTRVLIDGEETAQIEDGITRIHAETKAAQIAIVNLTKCMADMG